MEAVVLQRPSTLDLDNGATYVALAVDEERPDLRPCPGELLQASSAFGLPARETVPQQRSDLSSVDAAPAPELCDLRFDLAQGTADLIDVRRGAATRWDDRS